MSRRPPGPAPRRAVPSTAACGSAPARCEVGDALRLMSKAHVIDVLHVLGARGTLRFNELRRETGANANVLSLRLKDLVDAGLVAREDHPGVPPRVEYAATEAGRELLAAMEPLRRWGARHASARAAPPPLAAAPI